MPYTEANASFTQSDMPSKKGLDVIGRRILHESGIRVERVRVRDGYELMPGRSETQMAIAHMDQMLIDHPEWQAPRFDNKTNEMIYDDSNESSEELYGDSATLQEWVIGATGTQATALYPLQRPDVGHLPSGGVIDERSRAFFYHGLDAIGIRTRARIMSEIAVEQLGDRPGVRWISLACGGAVPVIEALEKCRDINMVHLDLVDYSPEALAFASDLAVDEAHLQKVPSFNRESELRSYTTHEINLIRGLIVTDGVVEQFGEASCDMVDALGIFEYFSKKDSTAFLKNAYRLVREDGMMVMANMLADRPEMEFNKRGVGWPNLYPRSIEELADIIVDAGIAPENVRMIIPDDGVYAVIEIAK